MSMSKIVTILIIILVAGAIVYTVYEFHKMNRDQNEFCRIRGYSTFNTKQFDDHIHCIDYDEEGKVIKEDKFKYKEG